ncbi:YD repeat-containing protein [Pedobacter sp. W3I1]|uniref:RHS repeat domain-containing protein n=1 Tax=Pedobacter sp. W3I1 TaxID=3042291 RepID=UPI00278216BB|nr:RHS repeat domain-containing protein [Pedobacter sp. W3I1]MDQ0640951.1 YD repeat-containing protein [Pedobacter sp. W3I1]
MKIFNAALIGYLFVGTVSAQTPITLNPSFDNVIPPSPNASSIGKFGSIPVGLSTGIPSVGVPIFEWNGKNFGQSVKVSLDYHAGGVQVDEQPSNVGLGWALNAGGVISRTMRGIYDEYPIDGFLYKTMPDEYTGNGPTDYPANERIFNRMYAGKADSQNDIFNFNFNGRSGRFVLGRNNDILLLDRSKLKIEKVITDPSSYSARITSFIITDEMGYKFEFSDYEVTASSTVGLPPPHSSAWYLSKIINPAGNDQIIFQYDDYQLGAIQTGRNQGQAIPLTLDGVNQSVNLGGNSAQSVFGKRIRKIIFNDNRSVSFQYKQANRSDYPQGSTDKALEKIIIDNGTQSYGFLLNTDYSLGGRLTLRSVQQFGSAESQTLNPYVFTYSTVPLPSRFSCQKDHWGYPNNNGSESMVQKEYLLVGANNGPYSPYREFLGGNRDTDPNLILAGSLTRITYPTGGYTEFQMEANKAVDTWLNRAIVAQIPNPYTEFQDGISFNSSGTGTNNPSFTYTGASNTNVQFTLSASPMVMGCLSCYLKIEIYKASSSLMYTSQTMNLNSSSSADITRNFTIANLQNGDSFYVRSFLIGYSESGTYYGYASLSRRQQNPEGTTTPITLGTNQIYVGGLRAKKVTDYTAMGAVASSREYEYVLSDGSTSSGTLGYHPVYSRFVKYDFRAIKSAGDDGGPYYQFHPHADYVIRSSSSANEIPLISGSPVTYKRVIEKIGQNGTYSGKIVRTFSSFADSHPFISEEFPTTPAQFSPWNYGLLRTEEIYDASNTILKKTENQYFNFSDGYSTDQTRVENFRSISFSPASFTTSAYEPPKIDPSAYPGYFQAKSFTPVAGRAELSQSTVTDYVTGQPAATRTTKYNYDPNNFYAIDERVNDSEGRELKTVFIRPKEMVDANEEVTLHTGMLNLNMINPVIKQVHFRDNVQVFMTKTAYKNWSGTLFAPEKVITKTYSNDEEIRLRYLAYDVHGAPVSVQKENGAKTTYIWGYGGDKLVAVLEDSPDYNSVSAQLGDIEAFRNIKIPSSSQIDNFLSPLGNGYLNKFKYNTLGGPVSITDTKGMTTYYEYDEFQRLKTVKDQNGNILKQTDYHYKN